MKSRYKISLRKLRSFGVSASLLATFLNVIVCRALTFGVVCCGGSISKHERKRSDKLVTKRGQAVGNSGQCIDEVYSRRVRHKLSTTLNDSALNTSSVLLTLTAAEWKQVEDLSLIHI